MPNTPIANAVHLEFAPGSLVRTNLLGAAFTLRGWSALLQIAVEADGDHLRLMPLEDSGTLIHKFARKGSTPPSVTLLHRE